MVQTFLSFNQSIPGYRRPNMTTLVLHGLKMQSGKARFITDSLLKSLSPFHVVRVNSQAGINELTEITNVQHQLSTTEDV